MFQILIVEDDRNTRKLLEVMFRNEHYKVFLAVDGIQALEVLDHEHVDLIIADAMMPNMSGNELTKTLRDSNCEIPILMLTSRYQMKDKREGFRAGIDDYLTKPFENEELLLRVEALLRRTNSANRKKLLIGEMVLDYESLSAEFDDQKITLPQKEFLLLFKLLSNPNKIFTRIEIMDEIWGLDSESSYKTINAHINNIRRKFDECTEFSIVAVRGLGYKGVINEK